MDQYPEVSRRESKLKKLLIFRVLEKSYVNLIFRVAMTYFIFFIRKLFYNSIGTLVSKSISDQSYNMCQMSISGS